jgi:hypothetical protein
VMPCARPHQSFTAMFRGAQRTTVTGATLH